MRRYAALLVGHAVGRGSALVAAAAALALAATYYGWRALFLAETELATSQKQKAA